MACGLAALLPIQLLTTVPGKAVAHVRDQDGAIGPWFCSGPEEGTLWMENLCLFSRFCVTFFLSLTLCFKMNTEYRIFFKGGVEKDTS